MKIKITLIILFFTNILAAQTKGVVKDSITGQPVPYVSIWVENENIGTTSEENGTFTINTTSKSKMLIFSSLGFKTKSVAVSNAAVVYLKPTPYQIEEIVLGAKRKGTLWREIGKVDGGILEAFDKGPKIDAKFFPFKKEYKKTKFIKQVSINTDSRIAGASFKIHFYSVNMDGSPGVELCNKDFIITVSKGNRQTLFDVTKLGLTMPKKGLFVSFEKMMIASNKSEESSVYYPLILNNWVERDFLYTFSAGKWNKQTKTDSNGKINIYEPAITLILTN
jgi:uncharacterized protein YifN (PemK superfamily)